MAQRGDELNTRITATDQASVVVDKVADKVAELEDRPHDVGVTADTAQAERQVSTLDKRLEGLTSEERRVVLDFMARDAQRDIDRLNRDLARAEKYDDTEIAVRVNARGDAQRRLDAIQAEIRDLDGASPTIRPEVDSSPLDELFDKLDALNLPIGSLGSSLRGLGGAGVAVGAVTALGALADRAADAAVEIDNVSKLTGSSVEQASRLAGVMATAGVESKDLQDILLQMGGVLADDAELAASLGINMNDGRDLTERFVQVVGLLSEKYTDAGERSVVASRLFGEEGVRQVNAVTAAYDDLGVAVENYDGKTWTPEQIERAREYQERLRDIRIELEEIAVTAGEGGLPLASAILRGFSIAIDGLEQLSGFDARVDLDEQLNAAAAGMSVEELRRTTEAAADRVRSAWEQTVGAIRSGVGSVDVGAELFRRLQDGFDDTAYRALRFGEDGVQSLKEVAAEALSTAGAVEGVTGAFDELLGRLSEESAVNSLADQWDRVLEAQAEYFTAEKNGSAEATKAQRDYRDELIKMALDVFRFAEQVGDIPERRLVHLATTIENGSLADIERALDAIFAGRTIRLNVDTPGPTKFKRTDDGGWERVDAGGSSAAVTTQPAPQVTHNYYTIAPSPAATDQALRDFAFANGSRAR